ncbi:type IX secretion system anionic LPS delivery protein PorZ [Polaribacter sp. P097]|uniref:type IX secretion system anionic LPS delivery protein PorZ n=1 Tax=Polaribacter sp. P097 TaxID=3117398 RepID=UPI002FDFAE5F
MKKSIFIFFSFLSFITFSQIDYSNSWEDFYSYNNVKDFVKVDNIIYALVDNAVFTFNESTLETEKFSSIQGLSGETTSAIFYSTAYKRLVVGYENGLVEVIDENGEITISSDITNFNQTGFKSINHIAEFENTLYLATPFATVEYNIEKLEFGDTFFIGNNSTSLVINETLVLDNTIYAATEDGIFKADATSNLLIDFNSWQQSFPNREFSRIVNFNDTIYVAENNTLYQLVNNNLTEIRSFAEPIVNLNSSDSNLIIALNNQAIALDSSLNVQQEINTTTDFNFTLSDALFVNNTIYLATNQFGVLSRNLGQAADFTEIHPEGPLSNDVFSIAAKDNDLWVVYGGYNLFYGSLFKRQGFSHYNGEEWFNTPFDPNFPVIDLNHVSIDPNAENRVYISSFGDTSDINSVSTGGLLVVENNEISTFYNHLNSGLEDLEPTQPNRVTLRISGSKFDREGNLWVANINRTDELKRLSPSGVWSSYDLSGLKTNPTFFGLSEIAIDNNQTIWMGTRRNGIYAFNENGNRTRALVTTPNLGNLPDTDVLTVAVDRSNRIWMGTRTGMVVFRNASTVFDAEVLNAQPVIIEENGVGERLLGDQRVNTIKVDGADNKWFGTENGGVLYTNPSGTTTLNNFSTQNSPLPSNKILKIAIDDSSGKVFFATEKGIVAYNSNVAPFGEVLDEVYAYPNPVLKNHNTVTITGRNGNNLPKGTNVKILDVAGYLVYETNVVEGQEVQGGKVVWDKRNLAGTKVSSGVYIVLLSNDDASETATAKIAIVN